MPPGEESPVPEEQEPHQPFPRKGARRELEQVPGGWGCPRAPWDTNRHLHTQDSAPSSLRAAVGTAGPRAAQRCSGRSSAEGAAQLQEQLGGAPAAAPQRELPAGSMNPTAQAPEHRAPGHSPGSGLPRDRQRPGGPRTARTLLPRAEQISGPAWEPPGPADGEPRSYCGG